MASTMTLSQLMTAVRQRADMLPNGYTPNVTDTRYFVTDVELVSYINLSLYDLYDQLISAYGANYFVKVPAYSFVTDGTTQQYTLPTDLYKLLGVDLQLSGTSGSAQQSLVSIKKFEFGDRNRFAVPNFQSFYGVTNLRYRLNGIYLWLTPIASAGQTIYLWYVPKMTELATLSDTSDGISGWLEYVIVDAAIKCLVKEESDVSALMAEKEKLLVRIMNLADSRDIGSPPKVTDATYQDNWYPTGNGSGNGSGSF